MAACRACRRSLWPLAGNFDKLAGVEGEAVAQARGQRTSSRKRLRAARRMHAHARVGARAAASASRACMADASACACACACRHAQRHRRLAAQQHRRLLLHSITAAATPAGWRASLAAPQACSCSSRAGCSWRGGRSGCHEPRSTAAPAPGRCAAQNRQAASGRHRCCACARMHAITAVAALGPPVPACVDTTAQRAARPRAGLAVHSPVPAC